MKTLYVFPHPDDESFGPAPVIRMQRDRGEEVHLLVLTKGGATKQRFRLGLSIEEMGEVRLKEMHNMSKVLDLSSLEVLDLVDGGLAQMNPIELEEIVAQRIEKLQPDIVFTYPIHGISGHPDHLTIHAVVKRLFCEAKMKGLHKNWKRLAFFTFPAPENAAEMGGNSNVQRSRLSEIDCVVQLNERYRQALRDSLYCYESYIETIENFKVIETIGDKIYMEFFDEDFTPALPYIADQLKERS